MNPGYSSHQVLRYIMSNCFLNFGKLFLTFHLLYAFFLQHKVTNICPEMSRNLRHRLTDKFCTHWLKVCKYYLNLMYCNFIYQHSSFSTFFDKIGPTSSKWGKSCHTLRGVGRGTCGERRDGTQHKVTTSSISEFLALNDYLSALCDDIRGGGNI
jgi:hypothetical protein